MGNNNTEKQLVAKAAVQLIKPGDVVGLGSGSTINILLAELGKLVSDGFQFTGVSSSLKTERLAESLGIPMQPLGTTQHIDVSIDGANEFNSRLQLVKGGGGSLFREKIVACLSKNRVIITDSTKKVEQLGKFGIPIEVAPFACALVQKELAQTGGTVTIRMNGDQQFISDNGNLIFDADFGIIEDPEQLAIKLDGITGIIEHGLFIHLTDQVITAENDGIIIYS